MMKTSILCPISDKKINERVARINAAFTFVLIAIFVLTSSFIPIIFLMLDFFMRATDLSAYSPIGLSSKGIVYVFNMNRIKINAGPKIFAARLGLLMVSIIVLLMFIGFPLTALLLAGVLGLFAFLEAAFGICVACEIYPYIYRYIYRS